MYAQRDDSVWVNLYVGSNADIKMDNGRTVQVTQETRYPWDGAVKMTVSPDQAATLTIHVRIPGWARNEPVASDLYRYAEKSSQTATLKVDGKTVPLALDKGYMDLTRTWKKGDTIELNLPMPVRRVLAASEVAADQGRVAIERGPIVYAAEWVDNPGKKVRNLVLPDNVPLTAEYRADLLKGVEVVKGRAVAYFEEEQGAMKQVTKKQQEFTAIPYYAWANRGGGEMTVWLPNSEAGVTPAPFPTLTTTATVTTSGSKSPLPMQDSEDPRASNDGRFYFDWWPQGTASGGADRVTSGWVEYHWDKAGDGAGERFILVRRHRARRRSGAGWVEDSLSGRQRVEAGGELACLGSGAGQVQSREFSGGDHYGAAVGSEFSGDVFGWGAEMAGEVMWRGHSCLLGRDSSRPSWESVRRLGDRSLWSRLGLVSSETQCMAA